MLGEPGTPEFINPFKKLRLSRNWTIAELVAKFGEKSHKRSLNTTAIKDLEDYRYTLVTVKVHSAYQNVFPEYDGTHIMAEYNEQKNEIRKRLMLSLKDISFAYWSSGHPLYYYISRIGHTVDSFADLIKIRKDNLSAAHLNSPNLPDIVKAALIQSGMSQEDIDMLSRMTNYFYHGKLPVKGFKSENRFTNANIFSETA